VFSKNKTFLLKSPAIVGDFGWMFRPNQNATRRKLLRLCFTHGPRTLTLLLLSFATV